MGPGRTEKAPPPPLNRGRLKGIDAINDLQRRVPRSYSLQDLRLTQMPSSVHEWATAR